MQCTALRGADKSTVIDCLDFRLTLREIPFLIADLEVCRPSLTPGLRAEVVADLEILAGTIEGADQEWPELERLCLRALNAIRSLIERLADPSAAAIDGLVVTP